MDAKLVPNFLIPSLNQLSPQRINVAVHEEVIMLVVDDSSVPASYVKVMSSIRSQEFAEGRHNVLNLDQGSITTLVAAHGGLLNSDVIFEDISNRKWLLIGRYQAQQKRHAVIVR